MRWGVAAGVVVAAAVWGGRGGVEGKAGADANANANANANADASADASASANANPDPAIGFRAVAAGADEEAHAVPVEGDLEIYVVRAAREGRRAPLVFLTGSCTHPLTYVKAFRHAAAEHGGLVALQGDLPCKADPSLRRWSPDSAGTSARIEAALLAAGALATEDITLIGYSQGAERAEWLARRYPAKYTRFLLIAGPTVPSPSRFAGARAIATLAGYGDVRENMADGAKRLRRASIPATYIELPGGTHHGELAPAADAFVGRALDWVDANAIPTETALGNASGNASTTAPHARGSLPKHRAH
jgi:pimeloyl-ACP methyl ester carboxylesterase